MECAGQPPLPRHLARDLDGDDEVAHGGGLRLLEEQETLHDDVRSVALVHLPNAWEDKRTKKRSPAAAAVAAAAAATAVAAADACLDLRLELVVEVSPVDAVLAVPVLPRPSGATRSRWDEVGALVSARRLLAHPRVIGIVEADHRYVRAALTRKGAQHGRDG